MQVISTKFKAGLLSLLAVLMVAVMANGQTVSLVANLSSDDIGFYGGTITYNSSLYFSYQNATGNYQLAKYDGTSISLIENPSSSDNGFNNILPVEYAGNLFFIYKNAANKYQLAKCNGTSVTLVSNLSNTDLGFTGNPIVYNNRIYCAYTTSSGKGYLAYFNGSSIVLLTNPSSSDFGFNNTTTPILFNNKLYLRYSTTTSTYRLAECDGNSVTLINDDSNEGFLLPIMVVNNGLVFRNSYSELAKFDGVSITHINKPTLSEAIFGTSVSANNYYGGSPIIYNGNLYFRLTITRTNGSGQYLYKLAKYDGSSITLISNPNYSQSEFEQGFDSYPVVYNNVLYFNYKKSAQSSFSLLARYTGSNNIELVENVPIGNYTRPFVFGGSTYFVYDSTGVSRIMKYNGINFVPIEYPTTYLINTGSYNVFTYNSSLFYGFRNSSTYKNQIGFINDAVLPLTINNLSAQALTNTITTSWQTTNEINVSHFNIQRSTDGNSFNTIGKVSSKGDGSYSFTDNQLPNTTVVHYRLQMVDKDGSFTYSKVVAVTLNINRNSLIAYPNPVRDNLFVQFVSTKAEKLTLQVTDLQGRLLQQEDTQVGIGNVSLSINTSTLVKGSYVLLVKSNSAVQQKQFIKE